MRRVLSFVPVAGLIACAACGASDSTSTSLSAANGAPPAASACSPHDLVKAAADLAGRPSTLVDLASLVTADGATTAQGTNAALNVLGEVARLADAGHAAGTWTDQNSIDGAQVTVLGLACGSFALSGNGSAATFQSALASSGLYEVRGGPADPSAEAISHDGRGGVQPPASGFGAWLSGRALFYGYPIATFGVETFGGYAMDISVARPVIPPATTPPALAEDGVVALCPGADGQGFTNDQLRIQKTTRILPVAGGGFLSCAPASASALSSRAGSMNLALAAALAGGVGGTVRNFSPHEVVFPASVNLSFVDQPANGTANSPITGAQNAPLAVRATGQNGTPWQGVRVQIEAVRNEGSFVAVCHDQADTDEHGIASFASASINKAGGYILVAHTVAPTADPDVTSFQPDSVFSSSFNLKNSKLADPCS